MTGCGCKVGALCPDHPASEGWLPEHGGVWCDGCADHDPICASCAGTGWCLCDCGDEHDCARCGGSGHLA